MSISIDRYGEWALVTGASSGIGRAFCFKLAEQGYNIILTARREQKLKEISNEIQNNYKIKTSIIIADLNVNSDTKKIIDETNELDVGVFVSNAGIGRIGPFVDNQAELIEKMITTNCLSSTVLIRCFAERMSKKNKGAIISISSVMAKLPLSYAVLYSATKSFNLAFGEALYYEMRSRNVDVLTVLPGSTSTEFDGFGNKIDGSSQRTVDQVVHTSLKALGKKPVVVDGIKNKINVILSKMIPTSMRLRITSRVAGRLYKKAMASNHSE